MFPYNSDVKKNAREGRVSRRKGVFPNARVCTSRTLCERFLHSGTWKENVRVGLFPDTKGVARRQRFAHPGGCAVGLNAELCELAGK